MAIIEKVFGTPYLSGRLLAPPRKLNTYLIRGMDGYHLIIFWITLVVSIASIMGCRTIADKAHLKPTNQVEQLLSSMTERDAMLIFNELASDYLRTGKRLLAVNKEYFDLAHYSTFSSTIYLGGAPYTKTEYYPTNISSRIYFTDVHKIIHFSASLSLHGADGKELVAFVPISAEGYNYHKRIAALMFLCPEVQRVEY